MNQHNHRTSDSSTDTLIIVGAIIFVTVGFFWGAWHYGSVAIVKITRTLFGIIELPFWYLQLLIKKITNSDASILNFTTNTISKLCYPDPNHYLNPLMNCTVNIKAIPFNFYYINNLFPSMLIAGALIAKTAELGEKLHFIQFASGGILGPHDSYLVLRGIKTLALRVQRHSENGMAVAKYLESHPAVDQVIYP